jgi:2-hydroxy-6-oxo-octa-2,4-dienoate hydrolase
MLPKRIRVDGLSVRYFATGEGAPVLLLHGASLGSSADVWTRNLAPLAAHGLRVIAPDLPGFGGTDNPPDHSVAYRKRFVLAFMDALDIQRAALVGHSQAGRVALDLAISEPQRVTRLVVLATGSLLPPLAEKAGGDGEEGSAAEPTLEDTRVLLEGNLYNRALITPDELELRHRMSVGKNYSAFLARKAAKGQGGKGSKGGADAPWQRVAKCPVPLLMLYGENDRAQAAQRAAKAKKLSPALNVVLLPRCAHLVQWDAAETFAHTVGRFLAVQ